MQGDLIFELPTPVKMRAHVGRGDVPYWPCPMDIHKVWCNFESGLCSDANACGVCRWRGGVRYAMFFKIGLRE